MKKIIVIGCPGSGKSTFSRMLNKVINIPVYHLDNMFYETFGMSYDEVFESLCADSIDIMTSFS